MSFDVGFNVIWLSFKDQQKSYLPVYCICKVEKTQALLLHHFSENDYHFLGSNVHTLEARKCVHIFKVHLLTKTQTHKDSNVHLVKASIVVKYKTSLHRFSEERFEVTYSAEKQALAEILDSC